MSENGNPIPQDLMQQNAAFITQINVMNGQIQFLEERIRELAPKVTPPAWPSTDMPSDPSHPLQVAPGTPRPDGQGQMELLPPPTAFATIPPAPDKLRIMIAVPMLAVSYEFFESFLKFWTLLVVSMGQKYELMYHFAYRKPVHMAEEYLVKTAQHNQCTHILLMDDDIFDVTPADLQKLIDAKKEFISGVMYASKFPHAMCVFRRYDPTKRVIDMPADTSMYRLYEIPASCPVCSAGQSHWDIKYCISCGSKIDIAVQPCDLVPFPFTLIDLKVFDKVKQPWFHCTNGYPTDSWFCDRLMEAGIKPYAHMLVRLNHAGITDATRPHYMQMGMAKMQQNKSVVHLSPAQMDIHQNLLVARMREVEEQIKVKPAVVSKGRLVGDEPAKDLTLITAAAPI